MLKKILSISLIIFSIIFVFFFFSKKITPQKINNKIDQSISKLEEVKETIVPKPTVILETGLPNKHLIKTAFIPQAPEKNWDQPWQDACEEASLLTVDYFYKNVNPSLEDIKNDLLKMIDFENSQNFTYDINLSQMALVGNQYLGYQSQIIDDPTVEDIKKYLVQNIPVIVVGSGKVLYQENKHFKSGGPYYHSLVILGYDDDKNQFTVHDVGTQFGSYFKYSYSLLIESIHDFPKSNQKEDILSGQKRVLILLK